MSKLEETGISNNVEGTKTSTLNVESIECSCPECQKGKKHYVQILDIDRYVNALNDWD